MFSLLYHGCCLEHLLSILRDNVLEIGFDYPTRGEAVSLSRSKDVARRFLDLTETPWSPGDPVGGVIILDRDALRCDYKLELFRDSDERVDEMEEVVRRDIKHLDRYLLAVEFGSRSNITEAINNPDWQGRVLGEPMGFETELEIQQHLGCLFLDPRVSFNEGGSRDQILRVLDTGRSRHMGVVHQRDPRGDCQGRLLACRRHGSPMVPCCVAG